MARAPWPVEYNIYLEKHWGKRSPIKIAAYLGKSVASVHQRAARMNLGSCGRFTPTQKQGGVKPIGVDYKTALPIEQWPMAQQFIQVVERAKICAAKNNKPVSIDLQELRECFAAYGKSVDVPVVVMMPDQIS
jgi:hypothetical protein